MLTQCTQLRTCLRTHRKSFTEEEHQIKPPPVRRSCFVFFLFSNDLLQQLVAGDEKHSVQYNRPQTTIKGGKHQATFSPVLFKKLSLRLSWICFLHWRRRPNRRFSTLWRKFLSPMDSQSTTSKTPMSDIQSTGAVFIDYIS